jgi:hypothetical protein
VGLGNGIYTEPYGNPTVSLKIFRGQTHKGASHYTTNVPQPIPVAAWS